VSRGLAQIWYGDPSPVHPRLAPTVNKLTPNKVIADDGAMRNLIGGGVVAAAIAAMLLAITAGGPNGWKFALAAVGLVLWVLGGVSKTADPRVPENGQNRRNGL